MGLPCSSLHHSLSPDFCVFFNMDMIVRLEDADLVSRELDTAVCQPGTLVKTESTYVKALMSVNSCLISPPSSFAFCFALSSSSGGAFSLSVTYSTSAFYVSAGTLVAHIVERHLCS